MKSSQARKTSITLPEGLEAELKVQAEAEHRTLSGILQEAARMYLAQREFQSLQKELAIKARKMGIRTEEDVDRLVHEFRRERQK